MVKTKGHLPMKMSLCAGEGSRTHTHEALDPKSSLSTNFNTPANPPGRLITISPSPKQTCWKLSESVSERIANIRIFPNNFYICTIKYLYMNKKVIILLLLCVSAIGKIYSQDSQTYREWIAERPYRAHANYDPYEFDKIEDTPAPKGYKPFYISHYGRHGSRSNWGGSEYEAIINVLEAADMQGLLTPSGDSLLVATKKVLAGYNGMDGRLTDRGAREHRRLAERMYHRYDRVFKKGNREIRSVSSMIPRCLVSMAAFTSSLSACDNKLKMTWDTGEQMQKYISNDIPKEVSSSYSVLLDSVLEENPVDTSFFMKRIFNNPKQAAGLIKDKVIFQKYIFNTAKIAKSFDIDTDIYGMLPLDMILYWGGYYNTRMYLGNCNSYEYGEFVLPLARPLVRDIIEKADDVIANGTVAADLRFGHDYPLLKLGSLMGLQGIGDRLSYKEVSNNWFGAAYTCFAANIQLIFYKNGKGDILVKCLLNEKETLIKDLEAYSGPYYKWSDVRSYWLKR